MKGKLCFAALAAMAFFAGTWKTDVEYGDPNELAGVERLFVWTTADNRELSEEATRQLIAALPALTIVESEEEGQALLAISRRAAIPKPGEERTHYVTTASVLRKTSKQRVRLLFELVSQKDDGAEAVSELVDGFANELKRYNHGKYGRAENTGELGKKRCRSIAGLRVGLSKKEVRAAIGTPTRVHPAQASFSQTWWYDTTDGSVRIVFAGDAVLHVEVLQKK